MKKNNILNVSILSISLNELLAELKEGILFTPNVDHLVRLQADKNFYESYKKADWIICDSNIIAFAAKLCGIPFKEVIPGSSLLPAFYNYHKDNKSIKIFLLGAADGVADKAKENINKKVGWDMVVGTYSPKFGFENDHEYCENMIKMINESDASVLVVGLGAPKQENWIAKYSAGLSDIKITMALGATIDFEAGLIKRAPYVYQKMYIEWYYRLLQEPKRLWKRYLIDDVPFVWYILQQKLGIYKNPFHDENTKS